MKKILFLTLLLSIFSATTNAQCSFGSFPPAYSQNLGWTNGAWIAKRVSLSSTATLTGLGLNSAANSLIQFRMAIYTDAGSAPGNLVASCNSGTIVSGQNTLSVIASTVINSGNYWIVAIFNASGPVTTSVVRSSTICTQAGGLATLPANNSSWNQTINDDVDYCAVINTPQF